MSEIQVLIKPASGMCNMSCDYCFYRDETFKRTQHSYGFMTEQTLKNVIRKTMLQAEGAITYAFQGGEPTLRGLNFYKKAIEFQQQYNKNHIRLQNVFQTNGYALDNEWCHFFREHNFLIGLSVDGTAKIHNTFRHTRNGKDTFDRILRASQRLDEYEVEYNILTVVTNQVALDISEIYQFYKERGWRYQQYIACLDPLREERGNMQYSLTPELYGDFLVALFHLWYQDLQAGNQPYIRQFENYVGMAAGYMAESCEQRGVCGIQNVVEADGSVYPCDFYMLDEYRIGNFNTDLLNQIYRRRRAIGFIEESQKLNLKCSTCRFYQLCRGGCQRNRECNADTGLYANYLCEAYQMFFEACYDKIVGIAGNILQDNMLTE